MHKAVEYELCDHFTSPGWGVIWASLQVAKRHQDQKKLTQQVAVPPRGMSAEPPPHATLTMPATIQAQCQYQPSEWL